MIALLVVLVILPVLMRNQTKITLTAMSFARPKPDSDLPNVTSNVYNEGLGDDILKSLLVQ